MASLYPREEPSSTNPTGGGGGGMTLPILLAIAIGGGVLLFICLALLLVALAGRRHRARAGNDAETSSTASPRPRRLTKPKPGHTTYMDMVEIREQQPHRSLASIMSATRGKAFGVFGGAAEPASGHQRGGHLRRNNSWIDEDAIHGPRVQKDDRRLSIRDSFILRTPTLPDLFVRHDKDEEDGSFSAQFEQMGYPQQPRPASLPAQRVGAPPRIPLPRTASYELAERLAAAARGGVPPSPQGGPRPVPLQRLRHKTTESDLAEILRSTEERLQNGTPSNSRPATRQRATSASAGSSVQTPRGSPTKQGSPVKGQSPFKQPRSPVKSHSPERSRSRSPLKNGSPVKPGVITHVGQALDTSQQRNRTPSPSKRIMVAPVLTQTPVHQNHRRNISQSSAVSDADSLFGETTPEIEHILPTGLSSPSRRSDKDSPGDNQASSDRPSAERCMSMGSLGSQASSSLSTLYSVNEPEDDSKTGGTRNSEGLRGRKPKGLVIDTKICDPFVTPPAVPPRSPKRQSSSLPPLRRISPPGEIPPMEIPFNSKSASNSPIPRPLDVVKRSSVVDKNQTRFPIMMPSPDMAPSPDCIRPRSVASQKPVFLVSSTSVASMKASPGTSPEDNNNNNNNRPAMPNHRSTFGQRVNVFPPPLNLRPGQGSPVRNAGSPGSVKTTSSTPTIRAVRASPAGSRSGSPVRHNADLMGDSRHGSPTPGRYKRRGMASPIRERVLSRQPANPRENRADRVLSSSDCPSIVLKPSDSPKRASFHRDFAVMGLQSTVAQLRRMNSQMSTFSAGSSVSDPDSPTLPNMRGGGFSPDRSNSRVSKIGRQNYLSLGTSPKTKRNTIKGARNSIAVIRSRPGGNPRLSAATEEEEKENEAGVIRGPRPLNPTPRTAGRGTRASMPILESPTRRRSSRLEETRSNNETHDSATSLGVYGEGNAQRRSSGSLLAVENRNGSNLRI